MDLDERLAAAVTDEETKTAILRAAIAHWSPDNPADDFPYLTALRLLDGPSAGWIGVGMMMAGPISEKGLSICVQWDRDTAVVLTGQSSKLPGRDTLKRHDAKRPDCALVLAARRAVQEPSP